MKKNRHFVGRKDFYYIVVQSNLHLSESTLDEQANFPNLTYPNKFIQQFT